MPSQEYFETMLEKAKEYLPEWLFNEIHKVARATAGGKNKGKKMQIDKLALEEIQPDKLKEISNDELSIVWLRLNQWYETAKTDNKATENFINSAIWVMNEMENRGINLDNNNELYQQASKLKEGSLRKDFVNKVNDLPRDLVVIKDFVSVVGSMATDKPNPEDIDILIRGNRDQNDNFLVQSENIWLPVRKALDPNKSGILHFIDNPQGSHGNFISLYDLVLRKKEVVKTEIVKQVPENPTLEPYKEFIPVKPQMADYTEAFDIQDLLKWADGNYPIGIEWKFNGFRAVSEKKGTDTRLWLEGQYGKNELNKIPEIQSSLEKIGEDFIIDCDIGLVKNGKRLPRPGLMVFNQENPNFPEGTIPTLSLFDILYYREDLTQKPFEERRKALEQFYNKYLKGNKSFFLSPIKWCDNPNEVKVATRWAFNQDMSEGLVAKKSDSIYPLDGGTSDWYKLKKVVEIKVIVLDKQETKTKDVFNYWGGLLPSDGTDYTNIKELNGKSYIDLGKTFSTSINANIGDILTIEVLEIIPDTNKHELAWLGARVIDIDDTREEPYYSNQVLDIAERGGILQKIVKSFVPSFGEINSIAFIGASPSAMESARGEPFIGNSGQIFNDMYLKPLGLNRNNVFLSNVVPEYLTDQNGKVREPLSKEVNQWESWLNSEIEKANPKLIIALGQTSKKALGDKADFVLPHPTAIRKFNNSGELDRKLKHIKQEIKKALSEEDGTRNEAASNYWKENWYKMYPKDGKGRFVYQHHFRGLTEEESKLSEEELLNSNHSLHGDLRFEGNGSLWGFSVFTGTAEANKKAGGDRLIELPQDDNLQGTFKLAQPQEWLTIAHDKPYISEPEGAGATSLKYAKFFEEDFGEYEIGTWREHMVEIFLNGKKLKGRFIIEFAPMGGARRVWLIDKPKDQTPYAENRNMEDIVNELKSKGQKYLVWASPTIKPKLINIGSEKVSKEYYAEIIKADNDKQLVTGIVLEPDSIDSQGDIINADEIEKACHYFVSKSRTIGDGHKKKAPAEMVESSIAPVDFELGGQKVKKGSWIITVKINDKKMWQGIKTGTYSGFSVGGYGTRSEE